MLTLPYLFVWMLQSGFESSSFFLIHAQLGFVRIRCISLPCDIVNWGAEELWFKKILSPRPFIKFIEIMWSFVVTFVSVILEALCTTCHSFSNHYPTTIIILVWFWGFFCCHFSMSYTLRLKGFPGLGCMGLNIFESNYLLVMITCKYHM